MADSPGNDPANVVSSENFATCTADAGGDRFAALRSIARLAEPYAHVPTSGFPVGVAALGTSGTVYLGANLEIARAPLYLAVHAEQGAISNALNHGEPGLVAIAVHEAPCGHCRQFLGELGNDSLMMLTPGAATTLSDLAPAAFGPGALGNDSSVLRPGLPSDSVSDDIVAQARQACLRSYSPYTQSQAAVAIRLRDGVSVVGSYIESVAFNPSLDPLRAALSAAQFFGWPNNAIEQVALAYVESAEIRHEKMLRDTLDWLDGPDVDVTIATVDTAMLDRHDSAVSDQR